MTTVAYSKGILAFDSKISSEDGTHTGWMTKGIKTRKHLIAACGDVQDIQAFFDWMKFSGNLEDKKKFGLDRECLISALAVDKNNSVFYYEDRLYPFEVCSKIHAVGSGAQFALGAMAFGASAIQAVRVASTFDLATGGTVRSLKW